MARIGHKERKAGSGYGGKNFVAPGQLGGFLQGSGNGTIFFFAEMDGVFDGGVIELAAEAEQDIELGVNTRRVGRALAGAYDFKSVELLAFFFEDDDDVRGGAGTEGHEQKLHGGWRGQMLGIEGDGVARRANGDELLFADPLDG